MNVVALSCQGPEMDTDSLVTSLLRLFVRLFSRNTGSFVLSHVPFV